MIAAAILTDEPVVLKNVPGILDVDGMVRMLSHLGVETSRVGDTLTIHARSVTNHAIPRELCSAVRTSFLFVAPLLHRQAKARVFPPGGDVIGRRRLDAHFYGLQKMGAEVDERDFTFEITRRKPGLLRL